jgi:hypothetical protein
MKNSLLIFSLFFLIQTNYAQVKLAFKDRFTQGFSVGFTKARYIFNLGYGFGEKSKSIFSDINYLNPIGLSASYNLEYRISKNFSLRTQLDLSKNQTILSLNEFSGDTRQVDFGSFDVGLPFHLMYRMHRKKISPIAFMGFKTMILKETGRDKGDINLAILEFGFEAGLGLDYNFKGFKIRPEVALYNGLTYWLNGEYISNVRTIYNIERDYFSFRLLFSQNKN